MNSGQLFFLKSTVLTRPSKNKIRTLIKFIMSHSNVGKPVKGRMATG